MKKQLISIIVIIIILILMMRFEQKTKNNKKQKEPSLLFPFFFLLLFQLNYLPLNDKADYIRIELGACIIDQFLFCFIQRQTVFSIRSRRSHRIIGICNSYDP